MTNINILLDKYMPIRKLSQKEFKRKFKPWISDAILSKIENKNKVFKEYMKCKDANRKNLLNITYKQLKNEITSLIKSSKKVYYEKYFTVNRKNLQNIWKGILKFLKNENLKELNLTNSLNNYFFI